VYTDVRLTNIRSFTFLPEVLPQALARPLTPIEGLLEACRLDAYTAHLIGVVRKAA
jgi:hypothetical protein